QGLEDLLHASANHKDQISAILHLVIGKVIPKPAALLFFKIERKTQAGAVNTPLTDLKQSPYSPLLGQGLCDLCEAGCVANCSKTVAVLDEPDARLAGLAGDVFMAIQDHLGGERRMPADLDGDMPPITVENVERVVVHIRRLPLKVAIRLYVPDRCFRTATAVGSRAPIPRMAWSRRFAFLRTLSVYRCVRIPRNLRRRFAADGRTASAADHVNSVRRSICHAFRKNPRQRCVSMTENSALFDSRPEGENLRIASATHDDDSVLQKGRHRWQSQPH